MAFKTKKNQKGFTIIETLITLAIGGMILMIVLVAIPTLLRNSRNNQRKEDVTAILDAVSSYQLNNSGTMPGIGSDFLRDSKLTYYDKTSITFSDGAVDDASIVIVSQDPAITDQSESNSDLDKVIIYNRRKCDSINEGSTTSRAAGYRDMVAIFGIETRNGESSKCLEL